MPYKSAALRLYTPTRPAVVAYGIKAILPHLINCEDGLSGPRRGVDFRSAWTATVLSLIYNASVVSVICDYFNLVPSRPNKPESLPS